MKANDSGNISKIYWLVIMWQTHSIMAPQSQMLLKIQTIPHNGCPQTDYVIDARSVWPNR